MSGKIKEKITQLLKLMDERFDNLESRFDKGKNKVGSGFAEVNKRLDRIEKKIPEKKLH